MSYTMAWEVAGFPEMAKKEKRKRKRRPRGKDPEVKGTEKQDMDPTP